MANRRKNTIAFVSRVRPHIKAYLQEIAGEYPVGLVLSNLIEATDEFKAWRRRTPDVEQPGQMPLPYDSVPIVPITPPSTDDHFVIPAGPTCETEFPNTVTASPGETVLVTTALGTADETAPAEILNEQ